MKFIILVLGLLLCSHGVASAESPKSTSDEQFRTNAIAMQMLSGWGVTNLVSGLLLRPTFGVTHERRYFFEMNAIYGGVNLAFGVVGLLLNGSEAKDEENNPSSSKEVLLRGLRYERIFWINAGVDLGMIMLGVALQNKENANPQIAAKNEGYGQSFVLQGLVLLILDSLLAIKHVSLNNNLVEDFSIALVPHHQGGIAFKFAL